MNPVPPVDESRLVTLVADPTTTWGRWYYSAACAGVGTDTYILDDGDAPSVEALTRCLSCLVATECLATALIHESQSGYRFGWWGGLGPDEREELAQRLCIETSPVELVTKGPGDLARHLRSQNRTIASIAKALGCTERSIYRYLADSAA